MAKPESKIRKALKKADWTLARETTHQIWRCPCGKHEQVTLPTTFGGGRGFKNAVAFIGSEARFGDCAVDIKKG